MRIALAQINPTLGDFKGNAQKIIEFTSRAHQKRADLVVFSELALFGYPPVDLLERPEVVSREGKYIQKISQQVPKGITAIFGAIVHNLNSKSEGGKPYQNVAVVVGVQKQPLYIVKRLLPSYDVFDETRFFQPGTEPGILKIPKVGRVGISICEDMWCDLEEDGRKIYPSNPLAQMKGLDLLVNISSSPYSQNKGKQRRDEATYHSRKLKAPFVYVNQVGGQDELIFDGNSFVLNEKGKLIVQAASCEEDLVIIDLARRQSEYRPPEDRVELLRKALVLGIRDFVHKTGQKNVHLGLSGGIDSALVATLAVDALGPRRVKGILIPGPFSSRGSVDDALKLAQNLQIETLTIEIGTLYKTALRSFANFFNGGEKIGMVEQNLQSRLRGLVLMAYSNATGSMLIGTSNKSELASGYCTLYGDTNGGLMPIGDLTKSKVYELARHYNQGRELIPNASLKKAPSAELAPNQKDQDTLPPYKDLDEAVVQIVEKKKSAKTKTEKWLLEALLKSEFKRWQAPPILRVSDHGFGRGRRMPIALKLS